MVMAKAAARRVLATVQRSISCQDFVQSLSTPLFALPSGTPTLARLFANVRSASIDPLEMVKDRLNTAFDDIVDVVATEHPILDKMARHFFEIPGKRMRPSLVLLMSMATGGLESSQQILPQQVQLSQITELIHVASLLHDDVIDRSDSRRGRPTINATFGDKAAVLTGDFLLARASLLLARLRNCDVTELMSTVIDDLVKGEIMQMRPTVTAEVSLESRLEHYLQKSYLKTASLLANSCESSCLLAGQPPDHQHIAREYGKHLGIAFQIIDDVLDFESSQDILGKPVNADLLQGVATAPVLFAMEERPELVSILSQSSLLADDYTQAIALVHSSNGLARARHLAMEHAEMAAAAVCQLDHNCDASKALILMLKQLVQPVSLS